MLSEKSAKKYGEYLNFAAEYDIILSLIYVYRKSYHV